MAVDRAGKICALAAALALSAGAAQAQTFELKLGIDCNGIAKISIEQFAILVLKNIERERIPAFFDGMDDFFEFGEHRLPEERPTDIVDLTVNDVGSHFWITGLFEQEMRQQLFVERACDLGQKNRVIVILKEL